MEFNEVYNSNLMMCHGWKVSIKAADGRYYSHTVQPQPDLFSGSWLRKVFG